MTVDAPDSCGASSRGRWPDRVSLLRSAALLSSIMPERHDSATNAVLGGFQMRGCQNQPISGVHSDGGYAEMMIAPASGLAAIPDDLLPTEAAPLLCAGLTTFNALRNSKARPGKLVAIQGIGGLGHLGIQFARRMGFRVAAIARGSEKESLAKKLGTNHYIDSNAQDPVAALQALGGARLILATAANSKSMSPLLGGLAPRGQLIVAGAGGDEPISVDPVPLLFGMRSLAGTMTGTSIDAEDTLF